MTKRLICFGDSWPAGWRKYEGLKKDQSTRWHPVKKPYPIILAEMLGFECRNYAMKGSSNFCILNEFLDYIKNDYRKDDFILVTWTSWRRLTILTESLKEGQLLKPILDTEFSQRFSGVAWGHFGHFKYDPVRKHLEDNTDTMADPHYQTVQSIAAYRTVRDICRSKGLKYLQTNSFCHEGFFERKSYPKIYDSNDPNWIEPNSSFNTLLDIVTDKWLTNGKKPKVSVYFRSVQNQVVNNEKYPLLNRCMHPHEEGHKLIAKTLAPYIKKKLEE